MKTIFFVAAGSILLAQLCGCGLLRQAMVRNVAGVFSHPSASRVFEQDDDPALIRDALPFALKTYETLLAADPKNRQLCLATAEGFVVYANAFVLSDAERLEKSDFLGAQKVRRRAARLSLRGRDYALAGLALDYPGFEKTLRQDCEKTLAALSEKHVPLLFWAAAGWAGAIAADPRDMSLLVELPMAEALMRRALELDGDFKQGAIHEFFIAFEGGRSEAMGGSAERARQHFDRVVELTRGRKAFPYVSFASSVAVRRQDPEMFKELLYKALAIDVQAIPEWRLSNTLAQEKAKWLLEQGPKLFVDYEEAEP